MILSTGNAPRVDGRPTPPLHSFISSSTSKAVVVVVLCIVSVANFEHILRVAVENLNSTLYHGKFRYKIGTVGNTVCSSRPCSCPRPACRYKSHLTEFSSSSLSLLSDLVVLKQH